MDINNLMEVVGNYSLILIPLVLGITQVIKQFLPAAFLEKGTPLVSLVIGILSSLLIAGVSSQSVVVGAVIGLSASGLWSTAVTPFKAKTPPNP